MDALSTLTKCTKVKGILQSSNVAIKSFFKKCTFQVCIAACNS